MAAARRPIDNGDGEDTDHAAHVRKRIFASMQTVHHDQTEHDRVEGQEDDAYVRYLDETYGADPPSAAAAAAASSATSSSMIRSVATRGVALLETGLGLGESRFDVPPLNKPSQRTNIPREDGYDPAYPREGTFGPHYMDEYRRRQSIIASHPLTPFLRLFAGACGVSQLERLFNVQHLESKAVRADIQKRVAELQQKILEQNLSEYERAYADLQKRLNVQAQGMDFAKFLDTQLNERQRIEEENTRDRARLSNIQRQLSKLELLQIIFNDWVRSVMNEPAGVRRTTQHRQWLTQFLRSRPQSERILLVDWLKGEELGQAVADVLQNIEAIIQTLAKSQYQSATGAGYVLKDSDIPTIGQQLVNVLSDFAEATYDAVGLFEDPAHHESMLRVPRFDLEAPPLSDITTRITLSEQIANANGVKQGIQANLQSVVTPLERDELERRLKAVNDQLSDLKQSLTDYDASPKEIFIGGDIRNGILRARELLDAYRRWNVLDELADPTEFLRLFGGEITPTLQRSRLLATMQDALLSEQRSVDNHVQALINTRNSLAEMITQLRVSIRELDRTKAEVAARAVTVQRLRSQLEQLDITTYQHRFDWVNRTENSGTAELDELVVQALARALSLVRSALRMGEELELDALIMADSDGKVSVVVSDFALLAGTIYKQNYMKTGRSYTEAPVRVENNADVNVLVDHFTQNVRPGLDGKLHRVTGSNYDVNVLSPVNIPVAVLQPIYDLQRQMRRQLAGPGKTTYY